MRSMINTRRFLRSIVQLSCVLFLLSCLSQVKVEIEPISGQLVVSGQISTISDQSFVELGRTAGTSRLPYPVEGAKVWLLDGQGNEYEWTENSERPGTFILPNFDPIPETTYFVRVALPEGDTYVSHGETMPASNVFDDISYTIEEKEFIDLEGTVTNEPFVDVYTNATFPQNSETVFVKWVVEEAYVIRPTDFPDPFGSVPPPCYVVQPADPQRIVLANNLSTQGVSTGRLLLSSRHVDRSFHDKHFFTVHQSSLTEEAYEYWRKIDIVANQVGSIFDTPPAAVRGNVYNEHDTDVNALGYFQAVNQSFTRFFLVPDDIPFTISYQICTYDPFKSFDDYPSECLNCLTLRNSSLVRPPWF